MSLNRNLQIGDLNKLQIPNFRDVYLGKCLFELTAFVNGKNFISATGSNVATVFALPFPFRLQRTEIKHTDTNGADDTDALTLSLQRDMPDNLVETILAYTSTINTNLVDTWGEAFSYPATTFTFNQNTTSTNRVYLKIVIQVICS